jgi:tetratricopeptide (TPR) repeat protein
MQKRFFIPFACALLALAVIVSSCESLKKMVKNHPTMAKYEVKPDPLEMRGDKIQVELKGQFAPNYFNTNAVVVVQPTLEYEGGSTLLKPYILRGEKTKGSGTLINKKAGGSFTYSETIDYKPEMEQSTFVLNPVAYVEKKAKKLPPVTTAEEAMKVPKAVNLGEVKPATGTMITSTRLDNEAGYTSTEKDKYEKETIIPKEASIYFVVDQYNLDWKMPLNKEKKNIDALKSLDTALLSGMQIKTISVDAWASPEGEELRNSTLSQQRALTGRKYVESAKKKATEARAKKLKVKVSTIEQKISVDTVSHGEDWDGFLSAVSKSDIKEKNTILNVINSNKDIDKRHHEINNMTVIYKEIEDQILPPLRRSILKVDFLEPKKTDEEIAELSLTAPDSLKLEELLYSATLTDDAGNREAIYTSATRIYPDDIRAYINLSALYITDKNYDKALEALQTANGVSPNNAAVLNNMGVVALAKGNYDNAKDYFNQSNNAEANKNKGILAIKEGNYGSAVSSMSSDNCGYNLALAQLLNNDIASAKNTLNCMNPMTADGLYLKAVCAARENNATDAVAALKQAISEKPALKVQAQKDVEFNKVRDNVEFQSITR